MHEQATTFVIYSSKSVATRVCKKLRDHGIIAGLRSNRGSNEVFGYPPERMGAEGVRNLCDKIVAQGGF